eukprot:15341873-Ditylum_brightwellii.AAC.1
MACKFKKQDNDKDLIISPNKIDQSDNDATEGDGIDKAEPSRSSIRNCKPTILFDPGNGPARYLSSGMVVNETLILNNHRYKLLDDEAEDIFSLLTQLDNMEDRAHPNACYVSKRYCACKATVAKYNPDMPTYLQALSGEKADITLDKIPHLANDKIGEVTGCALEDQQAIGWDNFLKGRISHKWKAAQKLYTVAMTTDTKLKARPSHGS